MDTIVETPRFILRELVPGDVDGLFELDSDPEVVKYLGGRPLGRKEQAMDIIRHVKRQYEENGIGRWVAMPTGACCCASACRPCWRPLPAAWLLLNLSGLQPLFSYRALGRDIEVYPVKFTVSELLLLFAALDLFPVSGKLRFGRDKLVAGRALIGFFGGLSGNQGALRSAFLIKAGLSKEAYTGTAVVVSTLVDFSRLGVYAPAGSRMPGWAGSFPWCYAPRCPALPVPTLATGC